MKSPFKYRHDGTLGFTLIEMMVTIVIIAILAAVAVVAFIKHIKAGRMVAAKTFLATLQAREETYFQRHGYYCNVNAPYPTLQGAAEPIAKDWNPPAGGWTDLGGARPEGGQTFFSFNIIASIPPGHALDADAGKYGIPDQPASPATPHPWYYMWAHGDLNGDGGLKTEMSTSSTRSQIMVLNEGE